MHTVLITSPENTTNSANQRGRAWHQRYDNLLNAWRWTLPEELTVPQLVKKLYAFYGTHMFITVLTTARHLSPSSAKLIDSTPSYTLSSRSMLISSYHLSLGLPRSLFLSGFLTKILCALSASPIRATSSARLFENVSILPGNGVRCGTVGWGIVLQAGRSRFLLPLVSLEFFIYTVLPAALWPWGWLSL